MREIGFEGQRPCVVKRRCVLRPTAELVSMMFGGVLFVFGGGVTLQQPVVVHQTSISNELRTLRGWRLLFGYPTRVSLSG